MSRVLTVYLITSKVPTPVLSNPSHEDEHAHARKATLLYIHTVQGRTSICKGKKDKAVTAGRRSTLDLPQRTQMDGALDRWIAMPRRIVHTSMMAQGSSRAVTLDCWTRKTGSPPLFSPDERCVVHVKKQKREIHP
jgi:hypothetical protein